jgi:hypothetical protein
MQFGFNSCPYCGSPSGFVYVHGHYQCKVCNQNVMPCCGGEQACEDDNPINKTTENEQ